MFVVLFSLQYVSKNSEHNQRAIPKQASVLTVVDERDDSVERQVQRIPTIDSMDTDTVSTPNVVTSKAQPEISTLKPAAGDASVRNNSVSSAVFAADETPHVQVESEEAREARLDKQWKQLKLDVADLPDVYARLSKIKLTGTVCYFLSYCVNYSQRETGACRSRALNYKTDRWLHRNVTIYMYRNYNFIIKCRLALCSLAKFYCSTRCNVCRVSF